MDQIKIGRFIAERRKSKGLTQMQLAERLSVTDRAVSKWENGRSMPDTSIMLDLCKTLDISVNDLLSGEVVTMNDYNEKLEKNLLDMAKQKEMADKRLLLIEIVVGVLCIAVMLSLCMVAAYADIEDPIRILLIVIGVVPVLVAIPFMMKIEQTAGYYECGKCHHRYVPKYGSVFFAMHLGRTRYLKCPKCSKRSWNKKVLCKDPEKDQ